ncbi:hypothetical protein EDB84DRAFT_998554 [Lactarius hengduanensis]|nr:hypothetical protein EDB84DRAFT_998554 [Lactarius hengduanensis]
MYQQPLRQQQTWSGPQFAQAPKPTAVSAWPTAPVISSVHPASAAAPVHHPASQQSFVPPVPPGVNPQQWQNGRWMFTAPGAGMATAQPHGHPPPSLVGWNVPAGWGITPQYYHPPQTQKQPERSYWDTQLTDNGLGLENMHIKQPVAHTAPGASKDKAPHTPWAWVPRELDDDDDAPQASNTAQYHNPPQPQQPGLVGHSGTGYPAQGHAYFSVPGDQQHHHPQQQPQPQRQQQPQQPSANEAGSRPTLPPATVFSAHIRQRSNPNPHQPTTPTHTQPSTAPGSQSSTAPVPSQPTHGTQSLQRSHFLVAPTPQRPGLPESFKSVQQLRPTFSPAIVRTPNHYRHDSQPMVPSPRVAPWEEGSAGLSASANRHLSGAAPMVPSPRVLPWNAHARASSPTPAPRNPQSSRAESSRMYDTQSSAHIQSPSSHAPRPSCGRTRCPSCNPFLTRSTTPVGRRRPSPICTSSQRSLAPS